ncbi:Ankyrin repeat-containing protein [Chitinophaga rupis]|uniref:Ankyrin repeat-containing protein n=1 Tax=Chitinophaga rupis TaxID=573321 RepID=A0A1H7VU27_9BACT|nr:ankyrin repeat domain-containing protein [Chitinophaga rupis]SEM12278.1 Ankyrin repeat-containing protein [Chitinophaga rupis]
MDKPEIPHPLFREAIAAIDAGDTTALEQLLAQHPEIVSERLEVPAEGYFKQPYLLWFIADNPIRTGTLPNNITDIAAAIIRAIQRHAPDTLQRQLNYTLSLVATGNTVRECGVQLPLMDLLLNAGAVANGALSALAHGNVSAAKHLLEHGEALTLPVAACLGIAGSVERLGPDASKEIREVALAAAAYYGQTNIISLLLQMEVDVNAFPHAKCSFHSHATALHQAVSSGSLDTVKILVRAGARLDIKDRIFQGTPLDWAEYLQNEENHNTGITKQQFARIASYLRTAAQ